MGENYCWFIYMIRFDDGSAYIGATKDLRRRTKEHRQNFGHFSTLDILEKGNSIQWRDAEHYWIEKLRLNGIRLRNKTRGRNGVQSLGPISRSRISDVNRGKILSVATRDRISRAQKGIPKNFTPEGELKSRRTRFVPGHKRWNSLSDKAKQSHRAAASAQWRKIPKEERSRIASARAATAWKTRTAGERAAVGRLISEGKLRARSPEERALAAKAGGLALHANYPDAANRISNTMKTWWANMTPEYRAEYLTRRAAARKAARTNAPEA